MEIKTETVSYEVEFGGLTIFSLFKKKNSQTIEESTMSGEEEMNQIIFFSPARAELFIVVFLLPRNQSHFLPAYVLLIRT